MRIYPASKARNAPWFRALRAAGLDIAASWVDWPGNSPGTEPTPDAWSKHWARCIQEASAADVVLFVAEEGATQCGALIEVGAALAAGRQVYVVSDYEWTVANHPRVRSFATLEAAIASLIASANGERQRNAA